jgi:hypothetical protein
LRIGNSADIQSALALVRKAHAAAGE